MARILVVDDEVLMRDFMFTALRAQGHAVVTVPRPEQALDAMAREPFDGVVVDFYMPSQNGLSVLKKIRQTHQRVPVIVYSGAYTAEMDKEVRAAGANEVLDKGMGGTQLVDRILKVVGAKERLFGDGKGAPKKILIVDDEEPIRKLLRRFFAAKGYQTLEAEDGRPAVELVRAEKPSVVLLDMHMPVLTGLETLKKIFEVNPKQGVVMVTGDANDETVRQAMAMGAYGYVLKPFDFLYLELVVASKLKIASSS